MAEESQIQEHGLSLVNFVNLSLSLCVGMWWLIMVPQLSISVGLRVEKPGPAEERVFTVTFGILAKQ